MSTARTLNPKLLKDFLENKVGKMTLFPDTKMLPTYLYCVIAGEYEELKLEKTYNVILALFREFQCRYTALSLYINIWKKWHLSYFKSQFSPWNFSSHFSAINLVSINMIKFLLINTNGEQWKMLPLSHLTTNIFSNKRFQLKAILIWQILFLISLLIIGLEI